MSLDAQLAEVDRLEAELRRAGFSTEDLMHVREVLRREYRPLD